MARKSTESEDPELDESDSGKDEKKDKKKGKNDEVPEEVSKRSQYIGLGLIASVIVGFSPLRDAFQGNGSFENAMFRFLACFVVCVFAASILGRMIEAAPEPEESDEPEGVDRADRVDGVDGVDRPLVTPAGPDGGHPESQDGGTADGAAGPDRAQGAGLPGQPGGGQTSGAQTGLGTNPLGGGVNTGAGNPSA